MAGAAVGALAVLVGWQPWADNEVIAPAVSVVADDPATIRLEMEQMRRGTAPDVSESLTQRQEYRIMVDRARSQPQGRPLVDAAAVVQAEKELMLQGTGSTDSESLTPRQEHELLVGR